MSGDASITGQIRIDPPITWAETRDHPHPWAIDEHDGHHPDAVVMVESEVVDTPDGVMSRMTGIAIVPTSSESNGYTLVEDVDRIAQAFATAPDGTTRTFTGSLHMDWAHGEYVCRVVVRDGRAVKVEPQVTWPDDARDGA